MAKQLNSYEVKLDFKADTSQAKKEIQQFQQTLDQVISKGAGQYSFGKNLTNDLAKASSVVDQLKINLQEAFNVDTGKLDLGKFQESMHRAGYDLDTYKTSLQQFGPEGAKAFNQLATHIAQAEIPLKRSNALLTEFWTTLKNTARWQISSSLLHGFMGAISSAYGYAQDLNESLNNIRIVTGYNVDKMSDFAAAANKAAQALSTTTTAYTDAALIYYQQGLSDEEVLGRTDVTIKLANVARESAETVSDQMTAVWNNFYDGSKSLEYYADVMTALGAATASSTAEISQGLEKFAAVADTVGLSYEYATAALATVTATTRQSADIVGTAFKTLFARLEQLKLGETLDDGTTLGQYSQALEKVGVLIKDDAGNLKDMDDILDELAAKWQTLAKDQQVALAQQVAGVRQYTQLIALMDNWDFMESNLEVARGAEGTLEEQAAIYAESWEAAQKRVKAAAEDIYGALLNDEFFIDLNDLLANILKGIKSFIDSIGGLKGVLSSLGVLATTVFRDQIGKSINDLVYSIKVNTKSGFQSMVNLQSDAIAKTQQQYEGKGSNESQAFGIASTLETANAQQLLSIRDQIDNRQRQIFEDRQKEYALENEHLIQLGQELDSIKKVEERYGLIVEDGKLMAIQGAKNVAWLNENADIIEKYLDSDQIKFDNSKAGKEARGALWTFLFGENGEGYDLLSEGLPDKLKQDLNSLYQDGRNKNLEGSNGNHIRAVLRNLYNYSQEERAPYQIKIDETAHKLAQNVDNRLTNETIEQATKRITKELEEYADAAANAGELEARFTRAKEEAIQKNKILQQEMKEARIANQTFGDTVVKISNSFLSLSSILNSIKGLKNIWSNEDVSVGEKLIQTMSSMAMITTMLINLKKQEFFENIKWLITHKAEIAERIKGIATKGAEIIVNKLEIGTTEMETAVRVALITTMKEQIATQLILIAKWVLIAAIIGTIIYSIYKLTKNLNDQNKELENTKNQGQELKSTYEELASKANEFKDAVSDYEDGVKALQDLDNKAKEYGETLDANNAKARQLIETYDLYDKYYYDNGQIKFKEGALEEAQEKFDSQARQAENNYLSNQIYATNLQNNIDSKNIIKESGTSEEVFNSYLDSYKKAYEAGARNADEFKTYLSQHADIYGDLANSTFLNLGEKTDQLVNALQKYYETIDKNSNALDYYTEQLLKNKISEEKHQEISDKANKYGVDYDSYVNAYAAVNKNSVQANQGVSVTGVNAKNLDSFLRNNYSGNWQAFQGITGTDFSTNFGDTATVAQMYAAMTRGGNASDYTYSKDTNSIVDLNGDTIMENIDADAIAQNFARLISQQMAVAIGEINWDESWDQMIQNASNADVGFDLAQVLLDSLANGEFDLTGILNQLSEMDVEGLSGGLLAQILGLTDANKEQLEALGVESVQEFINAVDEQLSNYDIDAYRDNINGIYEKEAEGLELDVEAFKAYRRILEETNPELAKNVELLNKVAIADKRVERGAKTLIDNWEEWNEIITRVGDNSQDLSTILPKVEEALADIANVNVEDIQELGTDFIGDNWDLITDSINGSTEALDELQEKIAGVTLENWLVSIGVEDEAVRQGLQELHAEIASFDDFPIEVPIDPLDNSDFIAKCNEMIQAAGMTSAMAQEYFSKMGFDAKFKKEKKTAYEEVADLQYTYEYDPQGNPTYRRVTPKYKKVPHDIDVLAIESITPNKSYGGNIKSLGGGGGGGSKGGGGGGKSSSPAESQKVTSKADAGIKRYKEIDDAIQDLTKDQERLNKVTDAYYGANKVAYMKQQHKLLQKEIDLHKERFKWAQKYYDEDKAELDKYAKETLGVEIEYDEDGSIKNYTPIMEDLFGQLNEKEKYWADASHFSSKEEQEEYKKANVDPIADAMKDFQKRVDTFDESNEERKEEMNKGIELMIEFKQQEYEIWQEGWKNQQDILEDQIKFLDHAKKMLGDSAADMGEALALTAGGDNTYVQNALDQLDLYKNKEQELHDLLAANKITQADYVKGMEEIRDGYLEQTENLKALDDEMMEYYGKILDKVISEIKEYTDAMDKLNSQLDRYMKVMKLTGRELDYDAIGDILEAQQKVLNDQYTTDVNTLQMLREREQHWLDELARQTTDEGRELIERQLKETREQLVETENQVLDDLAAQAEKASEILENARAKSMAVYEEMLTDGLGFDYVDGLLERQSTLQEEYLTKTNQVFETTKMLRKLQSDMDATNNRAAKQRLSNFSKEIEDLKNRESMTKADLELAQKRYDLLLAEIALEEAQKAKTTVRLQRDNEGNYGYVYTADEGDIAKAQDDLYNAENDLYNTRLRITNEYGEKIIQLNQEQADALNELWDAYYNKHSITEDEYEQKRAEIVNHYNELRKTYVHNYTAAQQNDARVVADAWINQDTKMIKSSETWQTTTDKLIAQTENAIRRYENTSSWLERQQETHFGNVEQETQKVTTASNELKDKVNEEVIPAYDDLWNKVDAVYKKYSDERKEVLKNIKAYDDLAISLQTTIDKYRTLADVSDIKTFNSNGDVKDTGTEVKDVSSNQNVGANNGGNKGGNNPSGGIPSGPTALSQSEVGKYITEYAKNYSSDAYDKTNVKLDLINGVYYSKEDVKNAVANWMAKHKKQSVVTAAAEAVKKVNGSASQDFGGNNFSRKAAAKMSRASGGYTGEWSDGSGKLAILHSNEIVLNSHDTDNMFGIIDMVREITKTIDVNAAGVIGGYGALSSGSMNAGPQTLEQNVQITASFPNATDHNEIEEAFNNLINKASQYANRTR